MKYFRKIECEFTKKKYCSFTSFCINMASRNIKDAFAFFNNLVSQNASKEVIDPLGQRKEKQQQIEKNKEIKEGKIKNEKEQKLKKEDKDEIEYLKNEERKSEEEKAPLRTIRFVIFGSIGVGKSTFGNALLFENAFRSNDTFESCTKAPISHSHIVNGVKIIVTDTVGFNDPEYEDEQSLKDLVQYFQNDFQGPINYFLLLQKFNDRFSTDMVKNINMLLTSFVGPIPTQNIKIVLTHAKGTEKKQQEKISELKNQILKIFNDFPLNIKEQVKKIPILVVNNHPKPEKRTPLPSEINPFKLNHPPAIDPRRFSPEGYSLTEKIIVEEGFIDKKIGDGIQIFATLVHRKRTEFTSFDKNTITYSQWENIDGQEPRSLCIQKAEYGQDYEDKKEIIEKKDNQTIKSTIHYSFKNKRIERIKFNKKEKQGEKEENSEVFYELTETLYVDKREIKFTRSKIDNDITKIYSEWYPDPKSEIKYEIQEITRPFEIIKESGNSKTKIFGEETQKLKIEYKRGPSGEWEKRQTSIEQDWHATKTNQNVTTREIRNKVSDKNEYKLNPEQHILIHETWQEERTVTFYDNGRKTKTQWIKIPGTERTTTTTKETKYRLQEIESPNSSYKYYTKMETAYEALEHVQKTTDFEKYREKQEITYIDGIMTNKTQWNKVSNSEEKYTRIEIYEIKGTKDQNYIRMHNHDRDSCGTHYHYFGVNHYTPFFGIEERFISRIYKKGSILPIDEKIGKWKNLILIDDPGNWQCIEDGISSKVKKF